VALHLVSGAGQRFSTWSRESRLRTALGRNDNHLSERTPLADASKRSGDLVERDGPIDVDPDLPGDAELGKGPKWAGPCFTTSTPSERPVSRHTTEPAVSTRG
jgi:hypothetical protein